MLIKIDYVLNEHNQLFSCSWFPNIYNNLMTTPKYHKLVKYNCLNKKSDLLTVATNQNKKCLSFSKALRSFILTVFFSFRDH